jgi:sialic acid synthase SpsE
VTDHDVVALRPAAGIGADRQAWLVGRRLARGVSAGMPIHEADVAALPRGAVHVA